MSILITETLDLDLFLFCRNHGRNILRFCDQGSYMLYLLLYSVLDFCKVTWTVGIFVVLPILIRERECPEGITLSLADSVS